MRVVAVSRAMRPELGFLSRWRLTGFHGVDRKLLPLALHGRGMDRAQIDAFCRELLQVLRQRPGLVRQLTLLRPGYLVRKLGFVEGLLCSLAVSDHKADCTDRPEQAKFLLL